MNKIVLLLIALFFTQLSFAQLLSTVESVEYDAVNNRFLVSNGNSIVAIDVDGNQSYFGSNLDADYGMEIIDNTLFAVASNRVKGYNLTTETLVMDAAIPGAGFLNGMASDGVSTIYVTDFSNRSIFKIDVSDLSTPIVEEIVSNTISVPNGIVYDSANNRLVFVNWQGNAAVKAVDLTTNSVSTIITTNLANIDGIDDDNDGNYYLASWSPARITKYDPTFNTSEIIAVSGLDAPADICYAKEINTLAIPNSGNATVTFVQFEQDTLSTSIALLDTEAVDFQINPNPATNQSIISFELTKTQFISLSIYDVNGMLVHRLIDGLQDEGQHRVLLNGLEFSTGIYFCQLQLGDKVRTQKIFIKQ